MTYDADLLIVGGGPAGLATAINARRAIVPACRLLPAVFQQAVDILAR